MKHVQKDSSVDDLISRYRKLKLNNFTPLESLQNNKSPSLSKHVNGSNLSSKSQQATTADVIDPRYFEKSPVRKTSIDEKFSLDIDEPENILDFKSPGGSRLPNSPDYSNLLGQNGRSSGASEKPASTNGREEGAQSARSPHGFTMPVSPHDIALLPQDARGGYLHTPRHRESLPLDGSLIDVDAMLSPGIGETPGLPFGRKGRDSAATNKAKRTDRFEDILGDDTSLLLPSSPEVSFTTHSPAVGNLLDF
ncbi:uncharacterized protein LOC106175866 [Lingula anatina]|uniref:Uncharacterized protein LOC106175866 n=1 Tax=Lingula anatina TaxID=7574 RepID=A0A1S3JSX6_LINAN|nr:uncharacterized protein LOC106175866 [Lingula anatina]|eukprot:XP_013413475.1 uncharacterized protein LOC106175866 [Lingula anatina]